MLEFSCWFCQILKFQLEQNEELVEWKMAIMPYFRFATFVPLNYVIATIHTLLCWTVDASCKNPGLKSLENWPCFPLLRFMFIRHKFPKLKIVVLFLENWHATTNCLKRKWLIDVINRFLQFGIFTNYDQFREYLSSLKIWVNCQWAYNM